MNEAPRSRAGGILAHFYKMNEREMTLKMKYTITQNILS
jgi:hypothetical protein